jgi:diguanylate cyclase (GGDEF)-like protein
MIVTFDLSTLLIISVSALAVGACLLLMSWLHSRDMHALVLWAAAFALGAIGVALIAARGSIPDFWSILIANAILTAAYGMMWTGVRSFEGRSTPVPLMLAGTLTWLVACEFEAFYRSLMARTALTSAIFVAYSVLSAVEFWRGRDEKLTSRWPIIVVLLGNALLFFVRIPLVGSTPASGHPGGINVDLFSFIIFETIFYAFTLVYMFGAVARERIAHSYKQASLIDPLTGVANRRAFVEDGDRLLRRAAVECRDTALLSFDLDRVKEINDTLGHHAGDRVLCAFCDIATSALRPGDLFGRLGGEEFASLLPSITLPDALRVAERIRARFAATPLDLEGEPHGTTVSIGVAMSTETDHELARMMIAADRALYCAKAKGGNRVESTQAPLVLREGAWAAGS